MAEEPKEVFDFDLEQLVMTNLELLPQPGKRSAFRIPVEYWMALVVAAVSGSLTYQNWQMISKLFTDVLPILLYLVVVSVMIVFVFQGIDMIRDYQRRIHLLDKEG